MGTLRAKTLVVLLVPSVLLGLGCEEWDKLRGRDDADSGHCKGDMRLNAHGYWVAWWTQGSGFTQDYVDQAHADAVERAADWHAARTDWQYVDRDHYIAVAKSLEWLLIDNCCFLADDGVQWAAGEYLPRCNRIGTAIFRRIQGTEADVDWTYPQTVRQNPANASQWRWGILDVGGEFPSLRHEMGHVFWGPGYEH